MLYRHILWRNMKETIMFGGVASFIATWALIACVAFDSVNAVATASVVVLMSWPTMFVIDAFIAIYEWRNQ